MKDCLARMPRIRNCRASGSNISLRPALLLVRIGTLVGLQQQCANCPHGRHARVWPYIFPALNPALDGFGRLTSLVLLEMWKTCRDDAVEIPEVNAEPRLGGRR